MAEKLGHSRSSTPGALQRRRNITSRPMCSSPFITAAMAPQAWSAPRLLTQGSEPLTM
jgi:hypothetical protein